MQSLGLSAANYKIYLATLASSYEFKVTVQILTNEHQVVSTISNRLLDGQVDAEGVLMQDGRVDVSRTCSLELLDVGRTLGFDSDSPADGALYLDRMVRVIYSVRCPFGWVDVHVFTGPVIKVDRDDDVVSVEAHGKEEFGLGQAWNSYTYKGTKFEALRGLLRRMGEADKYMDLPSTKEKLVKPVAIGRETQLWPTAFGLASSMNRILFYDGMGVVRTPLKSDARSRLTFRGGNGGLLCSEPQISYSTDDMRNCALVRGGKPKGSKKAVSATVVAPASHALNPFKIGRRGWGRYYAEVEENTDIRTQAKATARANALLKAALAQQTEATWQCLPVPHLDPWDIVTVATGRSTVTVRTRRFSLPLMADELMTVGYTKPLTKPRAVRRA